MKRAVFLDRDGVLNEAIVRNGTPHPPPSLDELRMIPGAERAIAALHDAGFLAIGITNQPDVARGTTALAAVQAMNAAVQDALGLDALYACFHDDADGCDCRKPKPGLVHRAAAEHDVNVGASYLIGDRFKDIACGRAAGCTTIFIDRGYAETVATTGADSTVHSLDEGMHVIFEREAALR